MGHEEPPLGSCAVVTYHPELIQHPFHALYLQHGLLWMYGEEATRQILTTSARAYDILLQASSLIVTRPQYTEYEVYSQMPVPSPLISIRYREEQYYYCPNFANTLFDEHFQTLLHPKWGCLKKKAREVLYGHANTLEYFSEKIITLTDEERSAWKSSPKKRHRTFDLDMGSVNSPIALMCLGAYVARDIQSCPIDIQHFGVSADSVAVVHYNHQDLIVIKHGREDYRLYDMSGRQVCHEPIQYFSEVGKGFFSIEQQGRSFLSTPYGIIEEAELCSATYYSRENGVAKALHEFVRICSGRGVVCQEILLTKAGYPFLNRPLSVFHTLLNKNMIYAEKTSLPGGLAAIFTPLSLEQLMDSNVLSNMNYLNQLGLDSLQYGVYLQWIDWPHQTFQRVLAHRDHLTFVVGREHAPDYQLMIEFSEPLSPDVCQFMLTTFNLIKFMLNDHPMEMIAPKLISVVEIYGLNALRDVQHLLNENKYAMKRCGAEFSWCQSIIDGMPSLSGQIVYYLLYSARQLLARPSSRMTKPITPINKISLIDLMCAYQFNAQIMDSLAVNPDAFMAKVKQWGAYADPSHVIRVMQHAIYHQADPSKHLYEREFLQNALDAYVTMDTSNAVIHARLYEENHHCVFSLEDRGVGMSLRDVFQLYCLAGASTKRADKHQQFIGGHGVGAFTAYHQAECIRLKTGQNQGQIIHVELRPVYSSHDKITDIDISWEVESGYFCGTVIERVAQSTTPALDAAKHTRTFKTHARTVDASIASITFNDEPVNRPLHPLATIVLPDLGPMVLYQSVEDRVTVAGLSVKAIDDLDQCIPEDIRAVVRKRGLIIDLPKKLPLNRERTDFIDRERVHAFLKPYLLKAYIDAYIQLSLTEDVLLFELPYDFFERIDLYVNNMVAHNPEVLRDADCICRQLPMTHPEKYQDTSRLHELMAYLPLFKIKKSTLDMDCEIYQDKYTLIELADYITKHGQLPTGLETPPLLHQFVDKFMNNKASIAEQNKCVFDMENVPEVGWIPRVDALTRDWRALIRMTEYIAQCMGGAKIRVGFSTNRNGALASATKSFIHWNVFAVSKPSSRVHELLRTFISSDAEPSTEDLNAFLDVVSHELTHALLEDKNTNTHNRTFYLKQRKILSEFSVAIHQRELVKQLRAICGECRRDGYGSQLLDWKVLVKEQLLTPEALSEIHAFLQRPRFAGRGERASADEDATKRPSMH